MLRCICTVHAVNGLSTIAGDVVGITWRSDVSVDGGWSIAPGVSREEALGHGGGSSGG